MSDSKDIVDMDLESQTRNIDESRKGLKRKDDLTQADEQGSSSAKRSAESAEKQSASAAQEQLVHGQGTNGENSTNPLNGNSTKRRKFTKSRYNEDALFRSRLFSAFDKADNSFLDMCKEDKASSFVQRFIESCQNSPADEQLRIARAIGISLFDLCMDAHSHSVVQKAFEHLPDRMRFPLMKKLMEGDAFFSVAEDKYGCRVLGRAMELLSVADNNATEAENRDRDQLLQKMIAKIIENGERLSTNEFAYHIVQHVIIVESLSTYKDLLIERCLLSKLLSLSQEEYSSKVVEKALEFASPQMLLEIMDEIFDGYVPHPETKKDALDVLLSHEYGNKVVQRMLTICLSLSERDKPRLEPRLRDHWMSRLESRINRNYEKLMRYHAGHKTIDILRKARGFPPIKVDAAHSSHHE